MIIGVDIDNVCADWVTKIIEYVGLPATLTGGLATMFPNAHPALLSTAINDPLIYAALDVLPFAAEVLMTLSVQGVEIRYVTSRPNTLEMEKVTVDWLSKHWFPQKENLTMVGSNSKTSVYSLCNAVIEDQLENVASLPAQSMVYIYDRPWNKGTSEVEGGFVRVLGWKHFCLCVRELFG